MIFWIGEKKEEAKEDFWRRVHDMAAKEYTLAPVQSVGKLNALYAVAAARKVKQVKTGDMLVTRVVPEETDAALMDFKYNSGFFFEKDIDDLSEIAGVCDLRCQTLTYFGVEQADFRKFLEETRPAGIDRIVPMGKSMDFSLIWDGYDLIRQMSRRVSML